MRLKFQLNGTDTKFLPVKYKTIGITAQFYPVAQDFQTKLDDIVFSLEDLNEIEGWISKYGYFQGMPLDVFWSGRTSYVNIFKGQIDLSDSYKSISLNQVSAKSKLRGEVDWFSDTANQFSFAWLENEGKITNADFVAVPYVINSVPDGMQLIMLSISLFVMIKELIQLIKEIAYLISELATGISSLLFGVAQILASLLKIVLLIVFAVLMILAIIELSKQIKEQIFPTERFHKGMTVKRMFEVGATQLGLTFKSDLLNLSQFNGLMILPSKGKEGALTKSIKQSGVPTSNSAIYKYGDFVLAMIEMFNGSVFFEAGNVMRFERRDYKKKLANFQISNVFTNQQKRIDVTGYNTDEMIGALYYSFNIDTSERNTLDNFRGTNAEYITEGKTVPNPILDNIKNAKEVRPPFALGTRKDFLTELEKFFRAFAKFNDKVVGIFGGSLNSASVVNSRVGTLSLSEYSFSVPKLLLVKGNKLVAGQRKLLSARTFLENCYCIESFVPVVDPLSPTAEKVHNQYIKKSLDKHKIDADDFVNLQGNNYIKTFDNKIGLIESLEIGQLYNETAKIDYRVNELYDTNLKQTLIEGSNI